MSKLFLLLHPWSKSSKSFILERVKSTLDTPQINLSLLNTYKNVSQSDLNDCSHLGYVEFEKFLLEESLRNLKLDTQSIFYIIDIFLFFIST